MRHHSQPSYTPEPDVVHEIIGEGAYDCQPLKGVQQVSCTIRSQLLVCYR